MVDDLPASQAKRTLLMLHNEHKKAGLELERRILKLREEGKDPTVPQKRDVPKKSGSGDSFATDPSRASSPLPRPPMLDSHEGTVDESFMLLGGQRVGFSEIPHTSVNNIKCSRILVMLSTTGGIRFKPSSIFIHRLSHSRALPSGLTLRRHRELPRRLYIKN